MYKYIIKRVADIILSGLAIVLLAFPMLIVAIAIKIDDPGPVFFKQERVGRNKKIFQMLKFRSMKVNDSETTGWTTDKDPRKTFFGSVIRKFSVDELPQLINVLKGDMSLVGPRPEVPHYVQQFKDDVPLYLVRQQIRPGITGWAQINGRDELEIPMKAKLDGEYTAALNFGKFKGFAMDIKCLWGTIFSVLRLEGVVEGGTGNLKMNKAKETVGK